MNKLPPFVTALLFVALTFLIDGASAQEAAAGAETEFHWLAFPESVKFKVLGLPWFDENKPKLWRMPAKEMASLPLGVQNRSKCPSGARIIMNCTTTRLALRITASGGGIKAIDVYVNGQPGKPQVIKTSGSETELVLFQGADAREKDIAVYLPHVQEVIVQAIGVDRQTRFNAPEHVYAKSLPVVFYGSSVCQGSGAVHAGQTYEAILCRELNLDFVNLGFGGAGKAEENVVDFVNSIPACCYVFDLGKSYGAQDGTAFKNMLLTVRRSHPAIPIIVITPITSIKEVNDPSYSERSIHTRTVMRESAQEMIRTGDPQVFLVEGEDLLGLKEHAALSKDGVHPSDEGYRMIATKLLPIVKRAVGQ